MSILCSTVRASLRPCSLWLRCPPRHSPSSQRPTCGKNLLPHMDRKKQENHMVIATDDQLFSLKINLNFWMGWDIITPSLWVALEFFKALSHTLSHFTLITTWWGKKAKGYYVCFIDEQTEAQSSSDDFPKTTWLLFHTWCFYPKPHSQICKLFSRRFPLSLQLWDWKICLMTDLTSQHWPFIFLSKQVSLQEATTKSSPIFKSLCAGDLCLPSESWGRKPKIAKTFSKLQYLTS